MLLNNNLIYEVPKKMEKLTISRTLLITYLNYQSSTSNFITARTSTPSILIHVFIICYLE